MLFRSEYLNQGSEDWHSSRAQLTMNLKTDFQTTRRNRGMPSLTSHQDGGVPGSNDSSNDNNFDQTSPSASTPTYDSSRISESVADFEDVRDKLVQAMMLADRANSLSVEQRSTTKYNVTLQVPVTCLSVAKRGPQAMQCEPVIEMQRGGVRLRALSLARMQESVREMEGKRSGDGPSLDSSVTDTAISSGWNSAGNASNSLTGSSQQQQAFFNPEGSPNIQNNRKRSIQSTLGRKGDIVLIGVANVYLRCLLCVTKFSYHAPIVNPQGEIVGKIMVQLASSILPSGGSLEDVGTLAEFDREELALSDLLEKQTDNQSITVGLEVRIRHASGIPNGYSKMILCHYNIFCSDEPVVVLPKLETSNKSSCEMQAFNAQRQEFEKTQTCIFDHAKSFKLTLSDGTVDRLADSAVSIEVYGNLANQAQTQWITSNAQQKPQQQLQAELRRPGTKLRRYKSDVADNRTKTTLADPRLVASRSGANYMAVSRLAEEWLKLQRRIDLWVAIEELTEDGSYKKVSVVQAPDVKTGGIYQLRQGLNRRIRILIRPSELSKKERGTLPIECEAVTQVLVGCISRTQSEPEIPAGQVNNFARTAPDSYQEIDLDELRNWWCEAMNKWQSYLQENLQLLAKKQEKTASDEAREGYLLNRWVSSIQERDAILVPPSGSILPGAPATGNPPAGMEFHSPLIFVNLDDYSAENLQTTQVIKAGFNSYLDGEERATEEGKPLVNLPLIKRYATLIGAVASWDTNLHDDDFLNKITPPGERIYLVVAVHVLLSKPTLMTLVLRKRICINICRRNILSIIFRSPFSRIVNSEKEPVLWTGVAYQFVGGIPQMSHDEPINMLRQGKEESDPVSATAETFAEQYMRTIQAVNSELYLDRLRQEVALREVISANQSKRQASEVNNLTMSMRKVALTQTDLARSRSFGSPLRRRNCMTPASIRNTSTVFDFHRVSPQTADTENGVGNGSTCTKHDALSTPILKRPNPLSNDAAFLKHQPFVTSPATEESEVRRLLENFKVGCKRGSAISTAPRSDISEANMAWSRRERDKNIFPPK